MSRSHGVCRTLATRLRLDDCESSAKCVRGDLFVGRCRQAYITREHGVMAMRLEHGDRSAWQVDIDEETHARSNRRQRVKRLLLGQLPYEFQCGTNVIGGDIVFGRRGT